VFDPNKFEETVRGVVKTIKYAAQCLPKELRPRALAAMGNSGAPLVGAVALLMKLPFFVVRKKGDPAHSSEAVSGFVPSDVTNYLVVDDLIDSGKTVNRIVEKMHKYPQMRCVGAVLYRVCCDDVHAVSELGTRPTIPTFGVWERGNYGHQPGALKYFDPGVPVTEQILGPASEPKPKRVRAPKAKLPDIDVDPTLAEANRAYAAWQAMPPGLRPASISVGGVLLADGNKSGPRQAGLRRIGAGAAAFDVVTGTAKDATPDFSCFGDAGVKSTSAPSKTIEYQLDHIPPNPTGPGLETWKAEPLDTPKATVY
jgi:hypothetical protein